jgi:hypothetical protein
METLMGTAMPPPPQLLHLVQPDLLQELQPTSPSDHLVQKQGWTPDPPQLGQGLSEASKRSCKIQRADKTCTKQQCCGVKRAVHASRGCTHPTLTLTSAAKGQVLPSQDVAYAATLSTYLLKQLLLIEVPSSYDQG